MINGKFLAIRVYYADSTDMRGEPPGIDCPFFLNSIRYSNSPIGTVVNSGGRYYNSSTPHTPKAAQWFVEETPLGLSDNVGGLQYQPTSVPYTIQRFPGYLYEEGLNTLDISFGRPIMVGGYPGGGEDADHGSGRTVFWCTQDSNGNLIPVGTYLAQDSDVTYYNPYNGRNIFPQLSFIISGDSSTPTITSSTTTTDPTSTATSDPFPPSSTFPPDPSFPTTTSTCIPCYPPVGPIPETPTIDPPTTQLPLNNISILTTIPPNIMVLNPREVIVVNFTTNTTSTTLINTTATSTIKPRIIDCPDVSWIGKLNF